MVRQVVMFQTILLCLPLHPAIYYIFNRCPCTLYSLCSYFDLKTERFNDTGQLSLHVSASIARLNDREQLSPGYQQRYIFCLIY